MSSAGALVVILITIVVGTLVARAKKRRQA